jgi:hypothetical protein
MNLNFHANMGLMIKMQFFLHQSYKYDHNINGWLGCKIVIFYLIKKRETELSLLR